MKSDRVRDQTHQKFKTSDGFAVFEATVFVRLFGLLIVGGAIAFALIALWKFTAKFSWSSEPWLNAIPFIIFVVGISSVVLLVFIAILRKKKICNK